MDNHKSSSHMGIINNLALKRLKQKWGKESKNYSNKKREKDKKRREKKGTKKTKHTDNANAVQRDCINLHTHHQQKASSHWVLLRCHGDLRPVSGQGQSEWWHQAAVLLLVGECLLWVLLPLFWFLKSSVFPHWIVPAAVTHYCHCSATHWFPIQLEIYASKHHDSYQAAEKNLKD